MDATRVIDVLALARAFIEAGWCRGEMAKGWYGGYVWPTERRAGRWCVLGALVAASVELAETNERARALQGCCHRVLLPLVLARGCPTLDAFNDRPSTTKRQVLALFDQAAARVGKQ